MTKFRKRRAEIEAVWVTFAEWDGTGWGDEPLSEEPEWLKNIRPKIDGDGKYLGWEISTPEGVMLARPGDFIIRGANRELHVCKRDEFFATYEEV